MPHGPFSGLPAPREEAVHAIVPNFSIPIGHPAMPDGPLRRAAGENPAFSAPARVPPVWHDSCMVPQCGAAVWRRETLFIQEAVTE